jgi:hypothetical protein
MHDQARARSRQHSPRGLTPTAMAKERHRHGGLGYSHDGVRGGAHGRKYGYRHEHDHRHRDGHDHGDDRAHGHGDESHDYGGLRSTDGSTTISTNTGTNTGTTTTATAMSGLNHSYNGMAMTVSTLHSRP